MADYTITNFNQENGQITVNFTPLNLSYAIDLPIDENHNHPTGDQLDAYIKGFLPYSLLTRKQSIGTGAANAAAIQALVVATTPTPAPAPTQMGTVLVDGNVVSV